MRWIVKLVRRIRLLVAGNAVEREMSEEIRHHLAEATREHERSGMPTEEAGRAALRAFGGIEQTKENARDARGGRLVTDLLVDLRFAGRQIRRAPGSAFAMVSILAAALLGASLALSVARAYLFRPLPVPEPDRLVSVLAAPSRNPFPRMPRLGQVDWLPAAALFEETAAWDLDGFTVAGQSTPEYVDGSWVSPGFFTLLGWRPVLGRGFQADDYRTTSPIALISDRFWRARFNADPAVVGTSIRLYSTDRPEDPDLVTVVGVMPPSPWQVHRFTDVLRPLTTPRFFSLARLAPGVTRLEAEARLTAVVRGQLPDADPLWRMTLTSTLDEHVYLLRPAIRVLLAAAALLIILAHASAGALLMARGTARLPELAIRRALGASQPRLIRQLLVEATSLYLVATALALAVAPAVIPITAAAMERFGGVTVPGGVASMRIDGAVLLGLLIGVVVPFLVGMLLPLGGLVRSGGRAGLATGTRSTAAPAVVRSRRWLVASQVAVAVALLVQATLLVRSLRTMTTVDLGFDPDPLLKAHVLLPRTDYPDDESRRLGIDRILERIRAVPGVLEVAAVHPHPFRQTDFATVQCEGCDPTDEVIATPQTITADYFATMRVPVVAGRAFDQQDRSDRAPVAIISERLATRLFGGADPLGRRVRETDADPAEWLTVVGVTGEVRKTYSDSLYPDLYRPFSQAPRWYTALIVRGAGQPGALEPMVRAAVAAERQTLALSDVEPMTELLARRRDRTSLLAAFVGGIGILSFLLTAAGLYAVVGYLVRSRRREFAVRLALGARPLAIAAAALGEARGMVVGGLAAGVVIGAMAAVQSRAYLVGVSLADPLTYLAVVALVALVAGLAVALPAAEASRADPASTLREE